jgi:predicted aldo/keto reductase-like oxidoreductase
MKYSKWNYIKNINNKNINDKNINKNKNQDCIICRKKTPDYLSIFTLYKKLLENIKKEQKTFIKNMII